MGQAEGERAYIFRASLPFYAHFSSPSHHTNKQTTKLISTSRQRILKLSTTTTSYTQSSQSRTAQHLPNGCRRIMHQVLVPDDRSLHHDQGEPKGDKVEFIHAQPGPAVPKEFNVQQEGTKEERAAKTQELNK